MRSISLREGPTGVGYLLYVSSRYSETSIDLLLCHSKVGWPVPGLQGGFFMEMQAPSKGGLDILSRAIVVIDKGKG